MNQKNNVIGLINQFGANSFINNEPLNVDNISPVQINKDTLLEHLNLKDYFRFKKLLTTNEYIELNPTIGEGYKELIKNIYNLFFDYYGFLYRDITNEKYIYSIIPVGLISVEDPINLCFLGDIDNNNFVSIQNQLLPFELSEDNTYIVINIDESKNDLYIDNSFTTITIINNLNEYFKTYIRISDKNKRWSEWLEWKNDISININIFKVLNTVVDMKNFFEQKFLPTNEYECMNISYNILYDNNIFYNNKSEYECKINLFKINQIFSLSSYLIFLKSLLHNITYTPKEDKLSCTYINQWQIMKTNDI